MIAPLASRMTVGKLFIPFLVAVFIFASPFTPSSPGQGGWSTGAYSGRVVGIEGDGVFEDVEVILGRGASSLTGDDLRTAAPDSAGWFQFLNLPDDTWWVKVRKPGHRGPPARAFRLTTGILTEPATDENQKFLLVEIDSDTFTFHWEEDQTTAGYDYAAHVNEPLVVEFQGTPVEVLHDSSAIRLERDYGVLLVNSPTGMTWTQEHAYRLLETLKTIPRPYWKVWGASQWVLTSDHVENDIWITGVGVESERLVQVAAEAFVNASPRIALVDGKRGMYFSRRLHHAAVRFATDEGRDEDAYEAILQDRYGVTMDITRHTTYRALTAHTTGEDASRFQAFHAEEIIQIINMLEEMPSGMHATPGLQFLVRRRDGHPHPINPTAPAIAWTESGYIEFMERAFTQESILNIHRLILHEKAHFLWEHVFNAQTKADWSTLGGWFETPQSPSGWWTSKQTEFVSAYAHLMNPNEDMAESIAYFVVNPDKLRSRAIGKYEFIRDRIMQGNFYIPTIREDLTFTVYNLYPDYVFPGKIRMVDIRIIGAPDQDKTATIQIELHARDVVLEGAIFADARVFSEDNTYMDLRMYPVYPDDRWTGKPGAVLSGSFTISKHVKSGYWIPYQIRLVDEQGQERMESLNDFGWQFYINNALEDLHAPKYVPGTAALTLSTSIQEGHTVQTIEAIWKVDEDVAMGNPWACTAALNDELPDTYSLYEYGHYDAATAMCRVYFPMPDYMPSSTYSMDYLRMKDMGRKNTRVYFGDLGRGLRDEDIVVDEPAAQIQVTTTNSDTDAPHLNLNTIQISAAPINPTDPNGETLVTLSFDVRDDISGLVLGWLRLRDPQGVEHHYYIYPPDRSYLFPASDPSGWTPYTWTTRLPIGSAPGIWGLSEMTLRDRAHNSRMYDFTEIMHFVVEQ